MYSCESTTSISFRTYPSLHNVPCAHLQSLSIPIPATTNLLSVYVPFHKWNLAICTVFYLASFHKHVFEIHPCCSCTGSLFHFTVFSFLHGYTVSLIHSPVDEHLDCFQFGAITNTAMNICIQTLYTHVFSFISVDTSRTAGI